MDFSGIPSDVGDGAGRARCRRCAGARALLRAAAACLAVVTIPTGLTGCETSPEQKMLEVGRQQTQAIVGLRDSYEQSMKATWVGRPADELIEQFGTPTQTMEVTLFRNPPSIVVVYKRAGATGGCIDAFLVFLRDKIVADYFCR